MTPKFKLLILIIIIYFKQTKQTYFYTFFIFVTDFILRYHINYYSREKKVIKHYILIKKVNNVLFKRKKDMNKCFILTDEKNKIECNIYKKRNHMIKVSHVYHIVIKMSVVLHFVWVEVFCIQFTNYINFFPFEFRSFGININFMTIFAFKSAIFFYCM